MIFDVDEAIKKLLVDFGNLDPVEIDISFDKPDKEWASGISKPTVNIYLYDVRENVELRDPSAWIVKRTSNNVAVKTRPDVRIDLSYNITAHAVDIEDEHRLLSRVLLTLLKYPVLPSEVVGGELIGQDIYASTAHPNQYGDSPSDFWGAIDSDLKAYLEYRITPRLNLEDEISTGVVLTRNIKIGRVEDQRDDLIPLPLNIGGRLHDRDDRSLGIPNATVTVLEKGLESRTDSDGRFKFSGLLPGNYTFVISIDGQEERRTLVEVPAEAYDISM